MTDDTPTDHLTVATGPYLGVERDGDMLTVRDELGDSVAVPTDRVPALVDTLETMVEYTDDEGDAATPPNMADALAGLSTREGDPQGPHVTDDDSGATCPECGESLQTGLGGDECIGCGWTA